MLEELKEIARDFLGPAPDRDGKYTGEPRIDDISLQYSYEDLYTATKGFSPEGRLGAGAAGAVYRGTLRGGTEVAVKVMLGGGGIGGFEDEVRVLSRVRHPNLVTLLGWGHKEDAKYLIYELLTGGDVSKRLEHSKKGQESFVYTERLRVAQDSARGLSFMMNSQPKVFHRDIKPANILLEVNGGAKVADFGLASIARDTRQHLTVDQIAGTPGYACPSYIRTGQVSEKSEMYSFGIVLLELLLNQPPALAGQQGEIVYPLLQIVQPNVPGAQMRVVNAMDQRAGWPRQIADEFIDHAISCVHMMPERRPNFENVVRLLRHLTSRTGGGAPAQKPAEPQGLLGGFFAGMPAMLPNMGLGGAPAAGGNMFANGGNQYSSAPTPPANPYASDVQAGGYVNGDRGANAATDRDSILAEVILEAISSDGIDLASLPLSQRAIAFAVDPAKGRLSFIVGREYQLDFFDRAVKNQESRQTISRSHFELSWEPPVSSPTLRKLSGNLLFMDDRSLSQNEAVRVPDGTRLSFSRMENSDRFLLLKVTLRNQGAVRRDGQHPAVAATKSRSRNAASAPADSMSTLRSGVGVQAVLECVHSAGGDPRKLSTEDRTIPIAFEQEVEVGRHHQPPNFFEKLLQGESRWLTFISRSHCKLRLQVVSDSVPSDSASAYGLRLDNLSSNPLIIKKLNHEERRLGKGRSDILVENERLVFVANPGGEGETQFLEFIVRRSRSTA